MVVELGTVFLKHINL